MSVKRTGRPTKVHGIGDDRDPRQLSVRQVHTDESRSYTVSTTPKLEDGQPEQSFGVVPSPSMTVNQTADRAPVEDAAWIKQHV